MKPASAKHKGWETEKALADYLTQLWTFLGWRVERKRMGGALDKGDLTGVPGLTMEVKSSLDELFQGLKEARTEALNNGTYWYVALLRLRGIKAPGDWAWVMPVRQAARMYGDLYRLKAENINLIEENRAMKLRLQERGS